MQDARLEAQKARIAEQRLEGRIRELDSTLQQSSNALTTTRQASLAVACTKPSITASMFIKLPGYTVSVTTASATELEHARNNPARNWLLAGILQDDDGHHTDVSLLS